MTKRELIDEITHLNPTATPAFLAPFEDGDLAEYLEHLRWVVPPSGPWVAVEPAQPPGGGTLFAPAAVTAVGA